MGTRSVFQHRRRSHGRICSPEVTEMGSKRLWVTSGLLCRVWRRWCSEGLSSHRAQPARRWSGAVSHPRDVLAGWKILVPRESGKWQPQPSLFQRPGESGWRVPSALWGFNHSQGWKCSLQIRVVSHGAGPGCSTCCTAGRVCVFWEEGNKRKDVFAKDDIKKLCCKDELSKIRKLGN